ERRAPQQDLFRQREGALPARLRAAKSRFDQRCKKSPQNKGFLHVSEKRPTSKIGTNRHQTPGIDTKIAGQITGMFAACSWPAGGGRSLYGKPRSPTDREGPR